MEKELVKTNNDDVSNRVKSTRFKNEFVNLLVSSPKEVLSSSIFKDRKKEFFSQNFVRKDKQKSINIIEEGVLKGETPKTYLTYENLNQILTLANFKSLKLETISTFNDDFLILSNPRFLISLYSRIDTSTSFSFLNKILELVDAKLASHNTTDLDKEKLLKLKNKSSFLLSLFGVSLDPSLYKIVGDVKYISLASLEKALTFNYMSDNLRNFFKTNLPIYKFEVPKSDGTSFVKDFFKVSDVTSYLARHFISEGKLTPVSLIDIPVFYRIEEIRKILNLDYIGITTLRRIDYFKIVASFNEKEIMASTGLCLYRAIDIYNFLVKMSEKHPSYFSYDRLERFSNLINSTNKTTKK